MRGAGLHSLAVCYPGQVRTNSYFQDKFPEAVRAAQERGQNKLWQPAPGTEAAAFEIEMARYQQDPFRGTVERRVLSPGQTAMSLELPAAQAALAAAGVGPGAVDLLISVSFLPDTLGVGNAAPLARALGMTGGAWNLESACSGGLVALQTACGLVRAGQHERILVVVSCTYSRAVDDADSLAWPAGDGAGAFLVAATPQAVGLLGGRTLHTGQTCGSMRYEIAESPSRGPWLRIHASPQAGRLMRDASEEFVRRCCHGALAAAGVGIDQIALLVCNTPMAWYPAFCARALGLDQERTVNAHPIYGNIGPALTTANLYLAAQTGRLRHGDLVLLFSIASVASASAAVLRWGEVALGPPEVAALQAGALGG